MIHSFKNLQDQVLGWMDERQDVGVTRQNVRGALNQAHQERLSMYPWPHMVWMRPETLTLTSSQQIYALHQEYSRPVYFKNRRTGEMLMETPAKNLEPSGVDWLSDVDQNRFVIWGMRQVKSQPVAASVMTVVSTSDADTGSSYSVVIKGVTSSGIVKAEAIVLTGTVAVAGLVEFVEILAVTKSQEFDGTLTVTADAGVTEILSLDACEFGRNYRLIWFLYEPVTGDVIEYKFYRQPLTLINDFDIPEIPEPFSQILVWDALLLLMAYDGQLDNPRIGTFRDLQTKWENAMVEALWEGQSLGAEPRFIRDRQSGRLGVD